MSTTALRCRQAAISLRRAPLAKAATLPVGVSRSSSGVRRPPTTFRSISRSARRDEAGFVVALDDQSVAAAALDRRRSEVVSPPPGREEKKKNPIPDFRDASSALESKTTSELTRAAVSFGLCRLPPVVVRNAEPLLSASRRIFGDSTTDAALKSTLFGQFCAGENFHRDVRPAMRRLERAGIGSILDFAAEDDGERESDDDDKEEDLESKCDRNLETFKRCVRDAAALRSDGRAFAAVKVTALGDPKILERASRASREAGCREVGPLSLSALTEEEAEQLERTHERGRSLAREAADSGTRLLVDAEQWKFQPAIDFLVLEWQREFNFVDPVVYNTYQCYLKDAPRRLRRDLERSERLGHRFGAKLVRGAYMETERASAETEGRPSPVHDAIEDTHRCYDDSVEYLLRRDSAAAESERKMEVMLASHNRASVEKAIEVMNELGIHRGDPTVSFAQLYGMQDVLTFNLGRHGYRAYKYVPYGEVKTAVPYLIRRANENSSIVGDGVGTELRAVLGELSRRLFKGDRRSGLMP